MGFTSLAKKTHYVVCFEVLANESLKVSKTSENTPHISGSL
jgi:hypothetical protein